MKAHHSQKRNKKGFGNDQMSKHLKDKMYVRGKKMRLDQNNPRVYKTDA